MICKSSLAGDDDTCEINIKIADMILNVHISEVFIAAVLILSWKIITNGMTIFHLTFIENFSIYVEKSPVFERQMRNWISAMGDSRFEVRWWSILLVKPYCEFSIPYSWTSIVVEISNSIFTIRWATVWVAIAAPRLWPVTLY